MTARRRAAAAWAGGIACVVAAWGVAFVTPDEEAASDPFVIQTALDKPAQGRNIAVTVTDARIADEVTAPRGWSAEGTWLVLDLEAQAVVSETRSALSYVVLQAGGRTFQASERGRSLYREPLAVGIPQSGTVAFEIPADVAELTTATVQLGVSSDPRLDSVIELPLNLAELPRPGHVEWFATRWTNE